MVAASAFRVLKDREAAVSSRHTRQFRQGERDIPRAPGPGTFRVWPALTADGYPSRARSGIRGPCLARWAGSALGREGVWRIRVGGWKGDLGWDIIFRKGKISICRPPAAGTEEPLGEGCLMKIVDVEGYLCHFPLREPFHPSWIPGLPSHNNSAVILRLLTDEGIEGACAGVAFAGEWKGFPELIKLFLVGRDPFRVEDFVQVLRSAKVIGFRAWFVEVALWDIIGKAAGQPVYRLLGG